MVVALLAALNSGGCQSATSPTRQGSAQLGGIPVLDLTRRTVAAVKPWKSTYGYGLDITFTDEGWNEVKQWASGRKYEIRAQGEYLSTETSIGGAMDKEMAWVKSMGHDELSKERADELCAKIMSK
jgi:hypothetical protein